MSYLGGITRIVTTHGARPDLRTSSNTDGTRLQRISKYDPEGLHVSRESGTHRYLDSYH